MNNKNCCESTEGDEKKCFACCGSKKFIWCPVIIVFIMLMVFSTGYLFGKMNRMHNYGYGQQGCSMNKFNGYGNPENNYRRGQQIPVMDTIETTPSASSTDQ